MKNSLFVNLKQKGCFRFVYNAYTARQNGENRVLLFVQGVTQM
jgi:hypothetical protein